ncbi:type III-B CRISPR module RAMP protein Cmr6 [Micromonospora sp. SH-82]|uniref:type III-B CRISPR module RAMP protein Cmr6 n=1 Tax=Micromonospora sp. SH-82 TaxID=3132938 RepID=UPI003EC0CDE1
MLHRAAFVNGMGVFDTDTEAAVLRWAADFDLGQETGLLAVAAERRDRALRVLVGRSEGRLVRKRLKVTPQWRMAIGVGNRLNPYEIGVSLHGTYGCPVIPGSTLKGLTCAWARECGIDRDDAERFDRIFGLPRVRVATETAEGVSAPVDGDSAAKGSVIFLDGLPVDGPVSVIRDVVTPHQQPYYSPSQRQAPGEHHQPIPSAFLVVDGGAFALDFVGPDEDVAAVARWCATALDELGVGAKTSAGYGYLSVREGQP